MHRETLILWEWGEERDERVVGRRVKRSMILLGRIRDLYWSSAERPWVGFRRASRSSTVMVVIACLSAVGWLML